jgi:putative hydrolase of the HAD superfamily
MRDGTAEVTTLFWDNGGVILSNGWDRDSRQKAVQQFHLDPTEFEERHELMLNDFEEGKVTLDEYVHRVVFHHARDFTVDDFKKFMFDQSQPFPESLDFLGKLASTRRYAMATLNNDLRCASRRRRFIARLSRSRNASQVRPC